MKLSRYLMKTKLAVLSLTHFFWFMAINTIASSALNGKSNKYKIFRLKENL